VVRASASYWHSAYSFTTTLRQGYYAELDHVYFELLRMGLDRPYLRSSLPPAGEAKATEYETYAFMVWNFLETVVDRCESSSDHSLRETWYPIVATEGALHRTWFRGAGEPTQLQGAVLSVHRRELSERGSRRLAT
jgi:hypothetical protein